MPIDREKYTVKNSGVGSFIQALKNIIKNSQSGDPGLCIGLDNNNGVWHLFIEAHEPCDRESHANCTIIGVMDKPVGEDYDVAYKQAKELADWMGAVTNQEVVDLKATYPEDESATN